MAPRRRRRARRTRRRRGPFLPTPGLSYRRTYSGTLAAKTVTAMVIPGAAEKGSYRVSRIHVEAAAKMGGEPGMLQVAIRGYGGEDDINFSGIRLLGPNPIRIVTTNPDKTWWVPTKDSEHVGWLRNNGPTAVRYSAVAFYVHKVEAAVAIERFHICFPTDHAIHDESAKTLIMSDTVKKDNLCSKFSYLHPGSDNISVEIDATSASQAQCVDSVETENISETSSQMSIL